MSSNSGDRECCPVFDPRQWDEKAFNWQGKLFIRETIPLLFHMPFPPMISKKVARMWSMAEAAKTTPTKEDALLLFTDPTSFRSELYLSVTGAVPHADNVSFTGTFFTKVFDGPYNAVPKYIRAMDEYLARNSKKAKRYLVHYAYCPACAKTAGHNYMIMFAQV